jgi:hypothetical protein
MPNENYEPEWRVEEVPPATHQIQSMIDAGFMSLKISIQELVANAIDQDAEIINISKVRDEIIVEDNGNGCKRLSAMIQIGSHVSCRGNSVGRFGVGFKDAATWLAKRVRIESCTRGGKRECADADWLEMLAQKTWCVRFSDSSNKIGHGVKVILSGLRPNRVKSCDKVPSYVAELFSAAVDTGIRITVDGVLVRSLPQPERRRQLFREVNGLKLTLAESCSTRNDSSDANPLRSPDDRSRIPQ